MRRVSKEHTPDRPTRRTTSRVSATDAARNFSELLNRVLYQSEMFVVERGGRAVCEIRPAYGADPFTVADFVELIRALPSPGDEYLDHVERVVANQPPAESKRWRHS